MNPKLQFEVVPGWWYVIQQEVFQETNSYVDITTRFSFSVACTFTYECPEPAKYRYKATRIDDESVQVLGGN